MSNQKGLSESEREQRDLTIISNARIAILKKSGFDFSPVADMKQEVVEPFSAPRRACIMKSSPSGKEEAIFIYDLSTTEGIIALATEKLGSCEVWFLENDQVIAYWDINIFNPTAVGMFRMPDSFMKSSSFPFNPVFSLS